MENKLKSYFIMYWYLRRTFFSKTGPKPLKRKREKNVRICSPSLALKKKQQRGALERYCCWSSQVPICVPAPCDPSLWPLTPVIPVLNSDPQSCQSSAGAVGVSLSHTHLADGDQSPTSSPSPTEADQSPTLLHFWYSSSRVVSIPKCGMALRDAAHPLTTKGIESNQSKLLNCNQTVTKPMPQP